MIVTPVLNVVIGKGVIFKCQALRMSKRKGNEMDKGTDNSRKCRHGLNHIYWNWFGILKCMICGYKPSEGGTEDSHETRT